MGFEQVMRKLEGRAVDYRELLRTGAARTGRAEESVSNTDMINL